MREQMIGTRRVEVPDEPGPQGRESYGRIDFEELPNTRDLGGLIGVDGRRVKPRRLLRSGALGFGSTDDLKRLRDEYRLGLVVDLRNILREETSGITQEQAARLERAQRQAREEDDPVVFMEAVYPHLLLNQAGIEGYRAFLRAVLDRDADASLWHCYVGRDRCGMASVLIEAALGVSRSDIEADYLATNLYAPRQLTIDAPASLRLIDAAWGAADREFGGMLGYITGALGLDQADIAELRARYLEPAA